jgi:hypothetical protein
MWHQYPEEYLLNLSTRIMARRRTDAAKDGAVQAPATSGLHRPYPSPPNPPAIVLITPYDTIDYRTFARYVLTTRPQKESQEDPYTEA